MIIRESNIAKELIGKITAVIIRSLLFLLRDKIFLVRENGALLSARDIEKYSCRANYRASSRDRDRMSVQRGITDFFFYCRVLGRAGPGPAAGGPDNAVSVQHHRRT